MIINSLHISPDSSIPDILRFKEKYSDELGMFRTQLAKLTLEISSDKPIDVLRQEIQDTYTNEFVPAYSNFKKALKSFRIKWLSDNFFKISVFSTSATSVPMVALGLAIPQALLAGAGVSLLSSMVSYKVEKEKILRENPYSYLLAIEKNSYNPY